jgi:hypothetical protein
MMMLMMKMMMMMATVLAYFSSCSCFCGGSAFASWARAVWQQAPQSLQNHVQSHVAALMLNYYKLGCVSPILVRRLILTQDASM